MEKVHYDSSTTSPPAKSPTADDLGVLAKTYYVKKIGSIRLKQLRCFLHARAGQEI